MLNSYTKNTVKADIVPNHLYIPCSLALHSCPDPASLFMRVCFIFSVPGHFSRPCRFILTQGLQGPWESRLQMCKSHTVRGSFHGGIRCSFYPTTWREFMTEDSGGVSPSQACDLWWLNPFKSLLFFFFPWFKPWIIYRIKKQWTHVPYIHFPALTSPSYFNSLLVHFHPWVVSNGIKDAFGDRILF